MASSDKVLIQRFLDGDRQAFEELVSRHKDAVYAMCLSVVGNFHDAEDRAQETFIRAMKRLESLRNRGALRPWLMRMARNICRDWLRVRRSIGNAFELELLPARAPAANPARDTVAEAIARLPRKHREVTVLFYINGYSCQDIGGYLNVPAGTVKRRLHESRSKLKKELISMVRKKLQSQVPGEDFDKHVLEGMNVIAGNWRMDEDELSGMAWPAESAFRSEISRLVTKKDYPGDSVVVEFDAVCWGGWDGGHIQCFLSPYNTVEAMKAAADTVMIPAFYVHVSSCSRFRYSKVCQQLVGFERRHWSRQGHTYTGTSDFNGRHGKWYHVKCERLGGILRLWVDGVPIHEVHDDPPAPQRVFVMLGSEVAHNHFRNFRVSVPDEKYVQEHSKPLALFGPWRRKMEILARYPDTIVREAGIAFGREGRSQGMKQVADDKGSMGVPEVDVKGRPCIRSDTADGLQLVRFAVDDPASWQAHNDIRLEIEYLDGGADSVFALYNTWYHSGAPTEDLLLAGTGQWKRHAFHLRDVLFRPWAGQAGGHLRLGPNRRGDLHLHSIRLLEAAKPREAYEQVVAAFEQEIKKPQAKWVVPHYMLAMAEVIRSNLGRRGEAWELEKKVMEEFTDSEVMEGWCHTHRTSRW